MRDDISILNLDLILNSARLLILISEFHKKESFLLSYNRILLYDFYMKYPQTMLKDYTGLLEEKINFNEYYSSYHRMPNRKSYQTYLNYLTCKGFIIRKIEDKKFKYVTTELGNQIINNMNSTYASKLKKIATIIFNNIAKQSDKSIEEQIYKNTSQQPKHIMQGAEIKWITD